MDAKLSKNKDNSYTISKQKELYQEVIGYSFDSDKYKLSIKNCEAIKNGYDLDELVDAEFYKFDQEVRIVHRRQLQESLANMFQKAIELLSDKKFSEKNLDDAISWATINGRKGDITHFDIDEFIQSTQQNEWDVEIEMVHGFDDVNDPKPFSTPKLDADGCLILKRK